MCAADEVRSRFERDLGANLSFAVESQTQNANLLRVAREQAA